MKVTVIGAGNMGSAFVRQLARAGRQVSVAARDSARAKQTATALAGLNVYLGHGAGLGTAIAPTWIRKA